MENEAKPLRLLNQKQVLHRIGNPSRVTFWRMRKAGLFPAPVKQGKRNCWLESWVDDHIKTVTALGGLPE